MLVALGKHGSGKPQLASQSGSSSIVMRGSLSRSSKSAARLSTKPQTFVSPLLVLTRTLSRLRGQAMPSGSRFKNARRYSFPLRRTCRSRRGGKVLGGDAIVINVSEHGHVAWCFHHIVVAGHGRE